ncbi:MAG: cupin domain-containing protein [Acidiferrobacterales bacterium]|nr:cupin domain-containing protein [Acidiferrobacterales bacterium]
MTRIKDAKPYDAKLHYKMQTLRLQGAEASDLKSFSTNPSYFLPVSGAEWSASANEKVYVVLDGEVTLMTDDREQALGYLDSCAIGVNESRVVENRTNKVVTIVVIISSAITEYKYERS